jgi:hypothetical protein
MKFVLVMEKMTTLSKPNFMKFHEISRTFDGFFFPKKKFHDMSSKIS